MSNIIETLKTTIVRSREQYKRLAHPANSLDIRDELSELVENQHFILKQLLDTEEEIASECAPVNKEPAPGTSINTIINEGEKAAVLKLVDNMKRALDKGAFEAPEREEDIYRCMPVKEYFALHSGLARISVLLGAKK